MSATALPRHDASATDRLLEAGLIAVVVLAPLPFGAVTAAGRLALEGAALVLLLLWAAAGTRDARALPPAAVRVLLALLLAVAALQIVPLPESVVGTLSPQAERVRAAVRPTGDALEAETRLLGEPPVRFDRAPTLSVEPGATASALRTGAALCALLFVATHVAGRCGPRRLIVALLLSAALQSLYGLLVLVSGFDRIWHVAKTAYLDSATGTWINRNHFADYLAMALPCGAALWLEGIRRREGVRGHWLVRSLGGSGSRVSLYGGALLLGLAGLFVSFSRAGIALGAGAVVATWWLGRRERGPARRALVPVLLLAVALIPLLQFGADALWERFRESAENFSSPGNRASVWEDTTRMAASYPWTGSGFGTFAAVYPTHRSPEVRFFYAHAHNDLLQFFAEGGLPAGALLLALLALLGRRIVAALRGELGLPAVGIAAGLLASLFHALIDFNFHLPANAAVAAALAGVLWGLPRVTSS